MNRSQITDAGVNGLRSGHVLYYFQADAVGTKKHVALLNVRNYHVARSILRVEGHLFPLP